MTKLILCGQQAVVMGRNLAPKWIRGWLPFTTVVRHVIVLKRSRPPTLKALYNRAVVSCWWSRPWTQLSKLFFFPPSTREIYWLNFYKDTIQRRTSKRNNSYRYRVSVVSSWLSCLVDKALYELQIRKAKSTRRWQTMWLQWSWCIGHAGSQRYRVWWHVIDRKAMIDWAGSFCSIAANFTEWNRVATDRNHSDILSRKEMKADGHRRLHLDGNKELVMD